MVEARDPVSSESVSVGPERPLRFDPDRLVPLLPESAFQSRDGADELVAAEELLEELLADPLEDELAAKDELPGLSASCEPLDAPDPEEEPAPP